MNKGRSPGMPPANPTSFAAAMTPDGEPDIDLITTAFGLTRAQLDDTVGLPADTLQSIGHSDASATWSRVLELVGIISRIESWAGGGAAAMEWYRAHPIPAFGGRTAEAVVKAGDGKAVLRYLDHLAAGGFT